MSFVLNKIAPIFLGCLLLTAGCGGPNKSGIRKDPASPPPRSVSGPQGLPPTQSGIDNLPASISPPPPPLKSTLFTNDPLLLSVAQGEHEAVRRGSGPHIAKVQQALTNLGCSLPLYGIDSQLGMETKVCLESFQAASHIPRSRAIDQETLLALDRFDPDQKHDRYPEYRELLKDNLLEITIGIGFDDTSEFLTAAEKLKDNLVSKQGYRQIETPLQLQEIYRRAKMQSPIHLPKDRNGSIVITRNFFTKEVNSRGKFFSILIRFVTVGGSGAKIQFQEAMEKSDVSIYSGHGRHGGVLDFDDEASNEGNIVCNPSPSTIYRNADLTRSQIRARDPKGLIRLRNILEKRYKIWFFDGCETGKCLLPIRDAIRLSSRKTDIFVWVRRIPSGSIFSNLQKFIDMIIYQNSMRNIIAVMNGQKRDLGFRADGFIDNPEDR